MHFWLWLFYALITPMFWAINNVLDRMMMTRLIKNEYALSFAGALSRLPFFFVFLALTGFYIPQPKELFISLFTGFLVILPLVFYLKAMERDEATPIIILYNATNPIFVLLLSIVFLSERLNGTEGIAFAILLCAGIIGSLKFEGKLRLSRGTWWILLASAVWAIADVFLGYLLPKFPSALSLLTWEFAGSFLGAFLLLLTPHFRKRCQKSDFSWGKQGWFIFSVITATAFLGYYTFLKAFELERVSLTVVVTNIQPLLVFLFSLVFWRLWPLLFEKVDTSTRSVLPKAIAFICVLVGVYLLQL